MLYHPELMQINLAANLPEFQLIQWVEETQSTNADLYNLARQTNNATSRPWLLGAHLQGKGRGRAGRTWQNRKGANLMFSCAFDVFLPPQQLPAVAPLLGLEACLALRNLIAKPLAHHLSMKWPNDILWQSAKLAGILVEVTRAGTARLAPDHHVMIAGIGINLEDARALSQSMDRRIADWSQIAATDPTASTTATTIVTQIAKAWYKSINYASSFGFHKLAERYTEADALAGQHIHIIDNNRIMQAGIANGINENGELLIRTPYGIETVNVGEVSVRPQNK